MKNSLILGIVFLFIVSFINPMVIGNKTSRDINYGEEYFFDKMFFNNNPASCLDVEKIEYVKQFSPTGIENKNNVNKKTSLIVSQGLMDSPWPMKCYDTHHTGRSPYSTIKNKGDEIWKFQCHWVESGCVIDNGGVIYFGDFYNEFYALNKNGTLKWQITLSQFGGIDGSTPAIDSNGIIYVGSWDDYLHAIYPNGTKKWMYDTDADIGSSPVINEDGTIYFGTLWSLGDGGKLYALNPNGTKKWDFQTDNSIRSDPAIGDDGTIYFGSADTYLYAINPNGTLKWRFKTDDWVMGSPSIANDNTIYIGSYDGYLYAVYPNGTLRWKCIGGTCVNPAIDENGIIYVGSIDKLFAIYPNNGTKKWTFNLNGNIRWSSPSISSDRTIFIGIEIGDSNGGEIVAINPDGTERWRNQISDEGWISSSPAISQDGIVFIGSTHHSGIGYFHAIGLKELEADVHGPYIGIKNEPVQFTGSADGGYPPYSYHWDFGDDETSEEQNPTHEYDTVGNYTVTLTVTDDNESIAVDTTYAFIRESNDPPNKPTITGETQGYIGESYEYTFTTTDPDDDDIWFYIEWDDDTSTGWIGPYDSDKVVTRSHTWDEEGIYTIRAKAKDLFDDESDWGTLEVTMPVNQQITQEHPLLSWFLESFPNAFPLIKNLLG